MPFEKINAKNKIQNKIQTDEEFKEIYNETHNEYEIIKAIIRARKEAGITQKQLSQITGLKQQVISRIENDQNSPTLKNLLKLANGLNLKITVGPQLKAPRSPFLK